MRYSPFLLVTIPPAAVMGVRSDVIRAMVPGLSSVEM